MTREHQGRSTVGRSAPTESWTQPAEQVGKRTLTEAIAFDEPREAMVRSDASTRGAGHGMPAAVEHRRAHAATNALAGVGSAQDERPPVQLSARGLPFLQLGSSENTAPIQQRASGDAADHSPAAVHQAAQWSIATSASPLPHAETIQRAFGHHDISAIQAHTGADATASAGAMGAKAYATDDHVVLGESADLHTAAHEAAHVIQQRGGVQLKGGGVGEVGDRYERHADQVADAVVAGRSAEGLLDGMAGGGASNANCGGAVQRLTGNDFDDRQQNNNGKTDQENIRDAIVQAMRANLAELDWSEYWNHIVTHNHNTRTPQGNASTFCNDTQQNIRGYIEHALNQYPPYFNGDRLVFDSTAGGVCNGDDPAGPRTNVRVFVRVTEVTDERYMTDQVDSMVVETAFPIA
jgi:hypothetical protein